MSESFHSSSSFAQPTTLPDLHTVPTLQKETDEEFIARIQIELAKIESVRKAQYSVYRRRCIIVIILTIFLAPGAVYFDFKAGAPWITFSLIIILGYFIVGPMDRYAKIYKDEMIPRIAHLLGFSKYLKSGMIAETEMAPSKILPAHENYYSKNYFEGNYKGAHVRFAEAGFSAANRQFNQTPFKGLLLLIDMPHCKFYGTTVMLSHHGGVFEWAIEKDMGLERVDMVDPLFQKKYTVYTSDQVEARYLLDPMMLERVQKLAEMYNAHSIKLSYFNSQVLVMLSCERDLFAAPYIGTPTTDAHAILKLKQEIEKVLDLIDCVDNFLRRPRQK